jgi:hypothetical protein
MWYVRIGLSPRIREIVFSVCLSEMLSLASAGNNPNKSRMDEIKRRVGEVFMLPAHLTQETRRASPRLSDVTNI